MYHNTFLNYIALTVKNIRGEKLYLAMVYQYSFPFGLISLTIIP